MSSLEGIIDALEAYAGAILNAKVQIYGLGNSGTTGEEHILEAGRIPIGIPIRLEQYPTRETAAYLKFLVTYRAATILFESKILDTEQFQKRLVLLEKEKLIPELKRYTLSAGGSRIWVTNLTGGTAFTHEGLFSLFENKDAIRNCYNVIEIARVCGRLRTRYPGLAQQMDELFLEGKKTIAQDMLNSGTTRPQIADALTLLAVCPDAKVPAETTKQIADALPFLDFVRDEDKTTVDTVEQSIRLYHWADGGKKLKEFETAHAICRLQIEDPATSVQSLDSTRLAERRNRVLRPKRLEKEITHFNEWDSRQIRYIRDLCSVNIRDAPGTPLYDKTGKRRLYPTSSRLVEKTRKMFEALRPEDHKLCKRERAGELDPDAVTDYVLDLRRGITPRENVYQRVLKRNRDVAVTLLIDISGSTKKFLTKEDTVLDVMKESALYFSQGLEALGDEYAIYAFSGESAYQVDLYRIKALGQRKEFFRIMTDLASLEPKQYNHDGAALRYATKTLREWPAKTKMNIILSDGEPQDIPLAAYAKKKDEESARIFNHAGIGFQIEKGHQLNQKFPYQGLPAWEDIAKAVEEADMAGIRTFYVRVNDRPSEHVKRVFGNRTLHVANARDLPLALSRAYLTWAF